MRRTIVDDDASQVCLPVNRGKVLIMRTMTTAAELNVMIQEHIDARQQGGYVWHTGVYFQTPDGSGCNWNVEVNCKDDEPCCGAVISGYLDRMRETYIIATDDVTALPLYASDREGPRYALPLL
jgi:hypothetical protein